MTMTAASRPPRPPSPAAEPALSLRAAFRQQVQAALAVSAARPGPELLLRAAAAACSALLQQRWARTQAEDAAPDDERVSRRVHYLSMEFLMGRALGNALAALGLEAELRTLLADHGLELSDVLEREPDAALGNGGLGRLAACFLDAFAAQGLPAFGYGLRYRYGMFAQGIAGGRQVERPDDWMAHGEPWELRRPELRYPVGFGGEVQVDGEGRHQWRPAERLEAEAFDFIVPAHHSERVATLRQWQARAADPIDFGAFCHGDHAGAARHLVAADALNWVLYPDDSTDAGRALRLKQEAFLVSASLQDLIARHLAEGQPLATLGQRNAVHLNDTHPALAPAELMRLLLDEHHLAWDAAWAITTTAVSYTNHTLMPEALETWPVALFERLLPRHLQIVYEINQRFLAQVRTRFPGDAARVARMSLIDEGAAGQPGGHGERRVRMAAMAIVASHRVNGVSALHSELMVQTIFAEYAALWPERFHNVTNGVTPRRWLAQANPGLARLLDTHIGTAWRKDLSQLATLKAHAGDATLQREFLAVKRANKRRLAERVLRDTGLRVDVDSLFDVQIKRIHEYKRQLLNLLHVVARYQAIVDAPGGDWQPRTVLIAGKAASAYHTAKQVIRLAHDIGAVVNADPRVAGRLQLVFLPNYGVSLAEAILPAADLSEQISTAGTEASGTGNMKFALNGALTIGTWDGANIEMAEAMGVEDMFVFGLRADEVVRTVAAGYRPAEVARAHPPLQRVLDAIAGGQFSPDEPARYRALVDSLLHTDRYLLLADFADYVAAQQRVDALYRQPAAWAGQALRNVAGMGAFSADRTIRDYVERVWAVPERG
ncbi:glycogen/starch/alpha-glucan phosphorylase [Ideonella sp.]|uniref:glycogen/starch/alpha-glucan phosphorylase n=1 Tax=Ideonella sp. TaxID=1929293 RepID=UPI0035B36927